MKLRKQKETINKRIQKGEELIIILHNILDELNEINDGYEYNLDIDFINEIITKYEDFEGVEDYFEIIELDEEKLTKTLNNLVNKNNEINDVDDFIEYLEENIEERQKRVDKNYDLIDNFII